MSMIGKPRSAMRAFGVELEIERRGKGDPLLVFYSEEALELQSPFLDALAKTHELIIPSPPGFGRSERPDWIVNPDDIAYIMLDLVEQLGVMRAPVLGFSLGGWLALEMATKDPNFGSRFVLVDPVGVKIGGPTDRDIQDIWTLHPRVVNQLKWHDAEKGKRDFVSMPEEELAIVAHNIESTARFCWEPYMHNPRLNRRLHRVKSPTLFIWGANDGIVTPEYGRAYAALLPDSKFEVIAAAGHYPHLEQPDAVLKAVSGFLG